VNSRQEMGYQPMYFMNSRQEMGNDREGSVNIVTNSVASQKLGKDQPRSWANVVESSTLVSR